MVCLLLIPLRFTAERLQGRNTYGGRSESSAVTVDGGALQSVIVQWDLRGTVATVGE